MIRCISMIGYKTNIRLSKKDIAGLVKRDSVYTRGILRGTRIFYWLKSQPFYRDWVRFLN